MTITFQSQGNADELIVFQDTTLSLPSNEWTRLTITSQLSSVSVTANGFSVPSVNIEETAGFDLSLQVLKWYLGGGYIGLMDGFVFHVSDTAFAETETEIIPGTSTAQCTFPVSCTSKIHTPIFVFFKCCLACISNQHLCFVCTLKK